MWLVQGTSTCTQCWSSSRPRLLRATSWAATTPTSCLKQLLLVLWKDDHRVVQPRGKCPSCNCLAPPVCRFLFLFFHFLLMLWPAFHCSFMACCMSISVRTLPVAFGSCPGWTRCSNASLLVSDGKQFPSVCSLLPLRGAGLQRSPLMRQQQ